MYATDPMLPYYYIANYVLAAIAIFSLFLSIRSSKKVSEELKFIKDGLIHYTEPVIKLVQFNFMLGKNEEISCENPPIGLGVHIQNVSPVPAEITKTQLDVYYGDKKLDDIIHKIGKDKIKSILVHGEIQKIGTQQKKLFIEYLSVPGIYLAETRLWFEVFVDFSNLRSKKKFRYYTKQEIYFDCEKPQMTEIVILDETIEPISP